jgi:hypothetical protein
MRYVSVCSGIEAASVAWEPLGFIADEAVIYLRLNSKQALDHLVSKGIIKCVKAGGRKFHRPTLDSILLKRMEGAA